MSVPRAMCVWGVGTAAAQHPPAGRDGEVAGIRQQAPGTRGGAERRRASVCVWGGEAHLAAGRGWAGRTSGGSGSRGGAAPLVCWMQHNRGAGPQARPPRSAGGPRSAGPTRGDSDRRLGWALSPLTAHTHTYTWRWTGRLAAAPRSRRPRWSGLESARRHARIAPHAGARAGMRAAFTAAFTAAMERAGEFC